MTKTFVVSSHEFDSLSEATEQLQEWFLEGKLDEETCIYEVSRLYQPQIKLVENKVWKE